MKIRASHILVETKEQAENLLLDIKNGVSFEDLAIEDIDDIYWPRLAYGENIFEFTGDATFEISYREPRKVGAY